MALVWGNVVEDKGTIEETSGGSQGPHVDARVSDGEQGKPAVTHYKVLERFGYVTLVQWRETGVPTRFGYI